jgi:hypothetical protein
VLYKHGKQLKASDAIGRDDLLLIARPASPVYFEQAAEHGVEPV